MRSEFNVIVGGLLWLILTCQISMTPVHAQDDIQFSREPRVIAEQLREAAALGRNVLRDLEALPPDDSIPIDAQLYERARRTYYLIRTARYGLEAARSRQTYQDPMLTLAFKRVDQAWELSRTPVDAAKSLPRAEYRAVSIRDLNTAVRLVNQALALLP